MIESVNSRSPASTTRSSSSSRERSRPCLRPLSRYCFTPSCRPDALSNMSQVRLQKQLDLFQRIKRRFVGLARSTFIQTRSVEHVSDLIQVITGFVQHEERALAIGARRSTRYDVCAISQHAF